MGIYEQSYNVEFCDINENNKLSNKGILRLMQEIAIHASDKVGYSINTVGQTHFVWILLNWRLQVFSRPNWNTQVTIKTWPRNIEKFYSNREFEMYDENNQLIAIASSKWLLFNTQTNSIQKVPEQMIKEYNCLNKSVFQEEFHSKLKEPTEYISTYNYTIQRRDIDTNHHVNNLCYLDFAYQALPDEVFNNITFNHIEIMYKKSALYNEEIVFLYSTINPSEHIVTIKSKDLKDLHAIIKFSI